MAPVHDLKIWPTFFEEIAMGLKTWELRKDDRPFAKGDWLRLREWDPIEGEYTGRSYLVPVLNVHRTRGDGPLRFVYPGYCLLSLGPSVYDNEPGGGPRS